LVLQDLGFKYEQNCPNDRGFDYFYGYYNAQLDYYTKEFSGILDLHENTDIVTDESEIDNNLHSAYLFQTKVDEAIATHATDYPDTPMFLYYAMQLINYPFEVPDSYTDRCATYSVNDDATATEGTDDLSVEERLMTYCGMNVMLDEAIANLTCTLKEYGLNDNLILVIASDNGASLKVDGAMYPYKGGKSEFVRGGITSTAIVVSNLIESSIRGTEYDGLMHITGNYTTESVCN
jgi:arylsulfatase B